MIHGASLEGYDAVRRHAGLIDRAEYGRIAVSGQDRASYLHGLLTNDIASLQAGQGCYAAYLTAQGRMIADMWVYELGDTIILTVLREVLDTVLGRLDQFIFSEDVQLGNVTETFRSVAVVGPEAPPILASVLGVGEGVLRALPEHGNLRAAFNLEPVIVLRVTDPGEPGYEVLAEAPVFPQLHAALRAANASVVDAAVAETVRVEAGVPKFHQDMDEQTIPLEAGIEARAISLTKGCYVGQEVIIRVLHRGHGRVARKLVGLVFADGAPVVKGDPIHSESRQIGEVTSSAWSPAMQRAIALGYVQRDFTAPGTPVMVGDRAAEVSVLPFILGSSSAS